MVPSGQGPHAMFNLIVSAIVAGALLVTLPAARAAEPAPARAAPEIPAGIGGGTAPGQEDQLATDLEFRGGSFLLNGQKIR